MCSVQVLSVRGYEKKSESHPMEGTPSARLLRPRHVPTPKFEDRKKKLFDHIDRNAIDENDDEDSDLGPMSPLECSSSPSSFRKKYGIFVRDSAGECFDLIRMHAEIIRINNFVAF